MGIANIPNKLFEVIVVFNKPCRQCVEELRVAGRIGNPDVVHRVRNPDPKKVRPDDVDYVSGKPWVFVGGEPFCHGFPSGQAVHFCWAIGS